MNQKAVLKLTGWAGYSEQSVIVVGETPKKYRITPAGLTSVKLRRGSLECGKTTLVPKYAVRFVVDEPERNKYRNYGEMG